MVKLELRVYGWATIEVDEATPEVIKAIENGEFDWKSKVIGEICMDEDPTVDIIHDKSK